jgi:kumamolisin
MKFHTNIKFRSFRHNTAGTSYTPKQLASIYSYPPNANGTGKNVAVIELGGAYSQTDLNSYFKSLGLTVKPVVFHSIQGAQNTPDPNADAEVMLDLSVIGAMAPGVQLHCYTAPNTDAGFLAAIEQAIADKMDCISISWGEAEDAWSSASITSFNAAFQKAAAAGITVTAAAGDNGSADGETGAHVDFPASSPYVCGCGGTSLVSSSPINEVVWNDGDGATGGGVSSLFSLPTWQAKANVPGGKKRGVPDVAGNADPETGWAVTVDGQAIVVGGTSAVAPMIAALAAVLGQALGKNVGFLPAVLYSLPSGCVRDITQGNNGTYIAKSGFDCCTGQGVPVGIKLLAALTPTPAPAPTPTPVPPAPTPEPAQTRTIVVTGTGLGLTVDGKAV